MGYILNALYVLGIVGGIFFMMFSLLSAKRLTRFSLVFRLILGVIGISFGLLGLLCSPSSKNCFVVYSLLVFLFFGVSLLLFLRKDEL